MLWQPADFVSENPRKIYKDITQRMRKDSTYACDCAENRFCAGECCLDEWNWYFIFMNIELLWPLVFLEGGEYIFILKDQIKMY